jgi:hypothetical protein
MKVVRPALRVAGDGHVVALALHAGDDRADSGPRVEPAAKRRDLGRRLPELEEAEGGDKQCPASIKAQCRSAYPFNSFFNSLRNRQSVPWAMSFCGLDLIIPASWSRSA